MKVKQVSVFMENTPGRLAGVTKALGEANINILALTVAETGEFGVLRMIVDDWQKTVDVLRKDNFTTATTEVLAVEIPNVPGSLAKIIEVFLRKKINIEYVYAFVAHSRENALIVMRFEDPDQALNALKDTDAKVLSNDEVVKIAS